MTNQSPLITVIVQAIQNAARGLLRDFGELEHLQTSIKEHTDFVTAADKRVEKILHSMLEKSRPNFGMLLEGRQPIIGADPHTRWIIDPIDGSANLTHGFPFFSISVAVQHNEEIIAAVTYDPLRDELFWAEKEKGAYLNNRRLRVSGRYQLNEALLCAGLPASKEKKTPQEVDLDLLKRCVPAVNTIRRLGAASLELAYVAAGRCDGCLYTRLAPWDMAAGILLVKEAHGRVTDLHGYQNMLNEGAILATNGRLHEALLDITKS